MHVRLAKRMKSSTTIAAPLLKSNRRKSTESETKKVNKKECNPGTMDATKTIFRKGEKIKQVINGLINGSSAMLNKIQLGKDTKNFTKGSNQASNKFKKATAKASKVKKSHNKKTKLSPDAEISKQKVNSEIPRTRQHTATIAGEFFHNHLNHSLALKSDDLKEIRNSTTETSKTLTNVKKKNVKGDLSIAKLSEKKSCKKDTMARNQNTESEVSTTKTNEQHPSPTIIMKSHSTKSNPLKTPLNRSKLSKTRKTVVKDIPKKIKISPDIEIARQTFNENTPRIRSHRVASLNASCKVHMLYESDSQKNSTNTNSQNLETKSNTGGETLKELKSNLKTKEGSKLVCLPSKKSSSLIMTKKRCSADEAICALETKRSKRQCSINAAAIIAASYVPDKIVKKRKSESPKSVSTVKLVHETCIAISQPNNNVQIHSSSKKLYVNTTNDTKVDMCERTPTATYANVSSKIRDRLLAIELMERENTNGLKLTHPTKKLNSMNKKTLKDKGGRKDSIEKKQVTKSLTTTKCQITEVQINTTKGTKVDRKRKSEHKIETILGKDAVVRKYQFTKTTNESFVQMGTNSPGIDNMSAQNHLNRSFQSQVKTPSTNLPMLVTPNANACFNNYMGQSSILHIPYNQPYKTLPPASASINLINLGNTYASPMSSAFTVPSYNPVSFALPSQNYTHGFIQQAGPFIQTIDDPYLIHKPVPYHASMPHLQNQSPHPVQFLQQSHQSSLPPSSPQQFGINTIRNGNPTQIILGCEKNQFSPSQMICQSIPQSETANLRILREKPQILTAPVNIQTFPPLINLATHIPSPALSLNLTTNGIGNNGLSEGLTQSGQSTFPLYDRSKLHFVSPLSTPKVDKNRQTSNSNQTKNKWKTPLAKKPSIFSYVVNQRQCLNQNSPKKKSKKFDVTENNSEKAISNSLQSLNCPHSPMIDIQFISGGKRKIHSYEWSWEGYSIDGIVFINGEDNAVRRKCYSAMRHKEGDIVKVRDCVLLRSGPKRTDLPFVAKVCALWENRDDGEMMMSLLWYYRPEHTDPGRKPNQMPNEIFASKHRDVNNVACIDDKCYVLTYNEMCRYRKKILMIRSGIRKSRTEITVPEPKEEYIRKRRLPLPNTSPDMIFCCRKVYDFRQKRTLKNPM